LARYGFLANGWWWAQSGQTGLRRTALIAVSLGNALVAPVIAYVPEGNLSPPATFSGDHGGYQANEKNVANRLKREWASSNVRAHAVTQYYDAAQIDFVRILKAQGFTLSEIGTHARQAQDSASWMSTQSSLKR
jgi:creatinine amidohydrolase